MAKVKCPGVGCSFESKTSFLGGFKGIPCPNCGRESLFWRGNDKDFCCASCNQLWYAIPCPECYTKINRPLFLGIL